MDKLLLILWAMLPALLSAQTYEELIATPDLTQRPELSAPPPAQEASAQPAPEIIRAVTIEQPVYVEQVVEITNYITNYSTNSPPPPPAVSLDSTTTVNISNTVIENIYTLQPLSPEIFTAVFLGRPIDVRIFIERGVYTPNTLYKDGNTLLHLAVYNKQGIDCAAYLIEKGALLNPKNNLGQTPLHVAVLRTNLAAVELLVNKGASLTEKDAAGQTAMWLANIMGQTDMLKVLAAAFQSRDGAIVSQEPPKIKRLPNVPSAFDLFSNRLNHLSVQPISTNVWHQALYRPGQKDIENLIRLGYNPRDTDSKGQNALHIAVFYDNTEAARFLLSMGVPVSAKDNFGDTPLHVAAGRSSPELIKILLDYGADVLNKNKSGWTPLFEACLLGNTPAVDFLLQKGGSPNTRTATGSTPLHEAARLGYTDIIIALLDKGAVLYAADKDGKTPLHLAASTGNIQASAQLISRGSPVNMDDKDGLTPLHMAVRNNQAGLVQYLMEVGKADMFIPDNKGRYPLETAYALGNDVLIAYLASQYTAAQAKTEPAPTPIVPSAPVESIKPATAPTVPPVQPAQEIQPDVVQAPVDPSPEADYTYEDDYPNEDAEAYPAYEEYPGYE